MNFLLIGGIAAGVIVVVVVIIIIVVSSNSKKKESTGRKRKCSSVRNASAAERSCSTRTVHRNSRKPYAQPYQAEPDGAGETTLLDSGAGETTLLNGAGSAYLIRKRKTVRRLRSIHRTLQSEKKEEE